MANPVITNHNTSQIEVFNPKFIHGSLYFAGNVTYKAGTILSQGYVADITVTADAGNTGDGVVAAELSNNGIAKDGVYKLICTTAVANGGKFKLVDPSGVDIANDITIPAGAGASIIYNGNGLKITITDGGDDFALADEFDIEVEVVSTAFIPYAAGLDAVAILTKETTKTGGAGSLKTTAICVSGEVDLDNIVVDGSVDPIPLSVIAQLLRANIIVRSATNIDEKDNQ